ncbi:MAG: spermidine/putrescine ABC transporter substrate-binding protein, partial [Peptostreptococcaceae bacterium]
MKKIFKLFSLSICIVAMGLFFVGCSKGPSQEISFLNYGENIDQETIKEFEEKYGIKVNVETFDDMETMYQKISKGGVKYDVILVS